MADDDDDASTVSSKNDDSFNLVARPATPPRQATEDTWDFPPLPTSIDVLPPVGNVSPPPRKVLSDSNKESMYMGNCLMMAVRQGDEGEVKHWLRQGRSLGLAVTMDIKTGKSTLHFAAELGLVKIAQYLLDAGCSVMNIDKYGKTPLHCAISANQMASLKFLLPLVKPWSFHVPSKMTLVQTATKVGSLEAVNLLLAHGFLATETTGEGETALHLAARYGHLGIAKALVQHHAVLHAATHTLGHTPLHCACLAGHTDLATFLVRCGADAHVPDKTPGRKTPVDKCEDSNHRVTLNAVLLASLQFREAVQDQERAEVLHAEAMASKALALDRKKRGLKKDLAFLGGREALLVAKHRGISDMLAASEASRKRVASAQARSASASARRDADASAREDGDRWGARRVAASGARHFDDQDSISTKSHGSRPGSRPTTGEGQSREGKGREGQSHSRGGIPADPFAATRAATPPAAGQGTRLLRPAGPAAGPPLSPVAAKKGGKVGFGDLASFASLAVTAEGGSSELGCGGAVHFPPLAPPSVKSVLRSASGEAGSDTAAPLGSKAPFPSPSAMSAASSLSTSGGSARSPGRVSQALGQSTGQAASPAKQRGGT